MNRHTVTLIAVMAALIGAQIAFGQVAGAASADPPPGTVVRKRYQDMTEAERQNFRAEMEERKKQFENMSEEERARFKAEMRERFASRSRVMARQQQLEAISAIERELARLKASVESIDPEGRRKFRDLPEAERARLREQMGAAMRERQAAIRAIDQHLAKLRGPARPAPQPRPRMAELRAIHELAVKEKATETAKSIEELMARYQAPGRGRPSQPRPRPERPARPARPGQAAAGRKARPFALQTFDGKTVNLADYRGKIVVLEWFNFECPFVQHHYDKAKTMVNLANKYKDKGVVWLAINSTSHTKPADNKSFAGKHELPYPLLDDRSGKVGLAYGARSTPHMFIIDASGAIAYDGAIDNSPLGKTPAGQKAVNYVDKALAELVAGKEVSTPSTKPYGCSVKYAK